MPETFPTPPASHGVAVDRVLAGRYRLVAPLARGGMAEVWEATDEILTRSVAVKVLLPYLAADDAFVTRFKREAVAAARLSHPHIVAIYDTCTEGDIEAIVMELVRGSTLRELLDRNGPVPAPRAGEIAAQVADALDHAHRSGLVHRDVKPGNILLSNDGRVLVTDFGIAKAVQTSADLTEVGQVMGTAKYLSPEQVQGLPLDPRSDVYALGVVLYEMLCGRPPFDGETTTAVAVARLTTEPLRPRQVRPSIPRALEDIVLKAMARAPEARHSSAAEMRAALRAVDLRLDPSEEHRGAPTTAGAWPDATVSSPPAERTLAGVAPPRFSQSERSWMVPAALIVVVAGTLGLVGALLGRTGVGQDLFRAVGGSASSVAEGDGLTGSSEPFPVASTKSFDPSGDRREHDAELSGLADGNDETSWTTESYRTELSDLKPGVGVVLTMAGPVEIAALEVQSPSVGWSASVYISETPTEDLSGWGPPVTSAEGIDGDIDFDLGGGTGTAVLLWVTDVGEANRVEVVEARIVG